VPGSFLFNCAAPASLRSEPISTELSSASGYPPHSMGRSICTTKTDRVPGVIVMSWRHMESAVLKWSWDQTE
jgi:hypothetical protein